MEPILSKHKLQQLIDMKDLKEAPTGLTREKDFEEYKRFQLRKNLNLLPLQTDVFFLQNYSRTMATIKI
jgi:hypothetical protein